MDKNLNDLLMIDQAIGDFFDENSQIDELELNNLFEKRKFVDKALKLIHRLSNKNILELIRRSRYLNSFIDLKKFVKKYPLNKKYLKDNEDEYIVEYHKLRRLCTYLGEISIDYDEFFDYMNILDVDNVEDYLLSKMPNNQIYLLASETDDWSYKLHLFSYLKKKKK